MNTDTDWPPGVPYGTQGGTEGIDDLVSSPAEVEFSGQLVKLVRHAMYGGGGDWDVELSDISKAAEGLRPGEVIGIILHDQTNKKSPQTIEDLFEYLEQSDLVVGTVGNIMNPYP